jgi:site-specific DNA-methyltransferase (adenine-specific)
MNSFEVINNEVCFFDVEKAKKRISRYEKMYPAKDVFVFAQKIKFEEQIVLTRNELIAELNLMNINSKFTKKEAFAILSNDKFVSSYIKGNVSSFSKLKNYLQGNRILKIYNEDFRNSKIENESIDLIVTDPPYPKQYLNLYKDLAIYAERVLKPGGSLYAMAGQSYLPEIMNLMSVDGLKYNWTLCYLTPGGQSPQLWQRKVNTFWKPILWYTKGTNNKWLGDVVKSDVNDNDKDFHFWGQSISGMNDLIKRVSEPGDLILDPFLGGGTTGAACLYNLRNFIGIELDKDCYKTSKKRLFQINEEIING